MKYVIIGSGVAGVEAAKTIRGLDASGEILMISGDTHIHSRCMLHKFISGERDEQGLDFTERDFFERYQVDWKKGIRVQKLSPDKKELLLYAQEDGKLTLSVIDAATGKLLQCLDLLEDTGTQYIQLIEIGRAHV